MPFAQPAPRGSVEVISGAGDSGCLECGAPVEEDLLTNNQPALHPSHIADLGIQLDSAPASTGVDPAQDDRSVAGVDDLMRLARHLLEGLPEVGAHIAEALVSRVDAPHARLDELRRHHQLT